jgi:hypothetical protein
MTYSTPYQLQLAMLIPCPERGNRDSCPICSRRPVKCRSLHLHYTVCSSSAFCHSLATRIGHATTPCSLPIPSSWLRWSSASCIMHAHGGSEVIVHKAKAQTQGVQHWWEVEVDAGNEVSISRLRLWARKSCSPLLSKGLIYTVYFSPWLPPYQSMEWVYDDIETYRSFSDLMYRYPYHPYLTLRRPFSWGCSQKRPARMVCIYSS